MAANTPSTNPWAGFNWGGFTPNNGFNFGAGFSGPAYPQVNKVPPWLPSEGGAELKDQLSKVPGDFSTTGFDKASQDQQSRVLTTALNAGNNAATEYANKARQSGGSGMGAGLIKAEAGVAGENTAGQIALQREQFDASQREKAATLSSQIANNLGQLRDSYLKSLVSYATTEDSISADFWGKQSQGGGGGGGGGGGKDTGFSGFLRTPGSTGINPGSFLFNAGTGEYRTPSDPNNLAGQWNKSYGMPGGG